MKIKILDSEGNVKKELKTELFEEKIRPDILQRVSESEKILHPYSPWAFAGKLSSASGNLRHGRGKWKSAAGRGISRVPRKIFWRRGSQFYWQAAVISSAVGGRRAHPPKISSMLNFNKVNKKEKRKALLSALSFSASIEDIKKKYSSLKDISLKLNLPVVFQNEVLKLENKKLFALLEKIFPNSQKIIIQNRFIRAGRGKSRGRKYKKNQGMLFIVGNSQNKKIKGLEVKNVKNLLVSDLASNGARISAFTEQAIEDLEKRLILNSNKKDKIK